MDFLLREIASAEHGQRLLSGSASLGVGALFGAVGTSMLHYGNRLDGETRSSANAWGGSYIGVGALSVAYGLYTLAEPWSGEQAAFDYRSALGSATDYARAFAAAEARLRVLSAREAQRHWLMRGAGALLLAGSAVAVIYNEVTPASPTDRLVSRAFGGAGALFGGAVIAASYLIESPTERLMRIWERDPGMLRLQPTIAPLVAPTLGGITFGLTGSF